MVDSERRNEDTHGEQRAARPTLLPAPPMVAPSQPESMPLLATKLAPPRLPAALVVRERLLKRLDAAVTHRLTVVSASAGWGKTTLLSAWATARAVPLAWVSLDDLDTDATRFWVTVIRALQRCRQEVGALALAMLQSSDRPTLPVVLTTLLNDLAATADTPPIALLLDDVQVIADAAILASLRFLIDHLPPQVHLVLATRVDPDLPLARWRARRPRRAPHG